MLDMLDKMEENLLVLEIYAKYGIFNKNELSIQIIKKYFKKSIKIDEVLNKMRVIYFLNFQKGATGSLGSL